MLMNAKEGTGENLNSQENLNNQLVVAMLVSLLTAQVSGDSNQKFNAETG